MFIGSIDSHSHEGGLLASFTGSSPALGSIIVSSDDGTYIGKIDAVLGGTESPIAHIAHLDRKMDASQFIGIDVKIRPKVEREERFDRSRSDRNDRRRNDDRGGRRDDRRDSRRDDNRDFGRDNRRGNDRDNRHRGNDRGDSHGDNDWDCPKCNNSNFARRVECNRCGAPKPGGGDSSDRRNSQYDSRPPRRDDRQRRDSRDRNNNRSERKTFTDNDWECKKCNNSNFSFRTECNRCGEPKPGGGGNNRDRGPRRDNRSSGRDRGPRRDDRSTRDSRGSDRGSGPRRERGPRRDDRSSRDNRGSDRSSGPRRERGPSRDSRGSDRDRGPRREGGGRGERDPNVRQFRRARGKSSGHAHNRGPQPLDTRPLRRHRDD
ncbi:MAG: hypothetical protein HN689_05500 [Euryarchaeota archaeon]|jgi:rRNA processing protein Gar1|nr:hypothetical protein [Euryarchaeota archaeon]